MVGLLGEALDRVGAPLKPGSAAALLDVAVAGMRFRRLDAEQHEPAGRGDLGSAPDPLDEPRLVLHDVVGRHDREHGVGVVLERNERGDGDGRGGVAADRLEDDGARG